MPGLQENKVAGRDFVAERLAYLPYSEGHLLTRSALNVYKVGKNALRRLGTQIDGVFRVFGNALECLEHKIKLPDIGKIVLFTRGAGNVVIIDKLFEFGLRKSIDGFIELVSRFGAPVFDYFIGAETFVTFAAVQQRIGKTGEMTACHPRLRVHENCRVNTYVVAVFLDEFLPPCALDVVF